MQYKANMQHEQHAMPNTLERKQYIQCTASRGSTTVRHLSCSWMPVCLQACMIDSSALLYGFLRSPVCIVVVLCGRSLFFFFLFLLERSRKKEKCFPNFLVASCLSVTRSIFLLNFPFCSHFEDGGIDFLRMAFCFVVVKC